ncbi:MAG: universal stress protein [Reyranellaceae bacterium]
MFQHILVATDGSPLSEAAVDHAMSFAREAGARVTVLTATEPFHVIAVDSKQLSDTKEIYEKHVKAEAARYLESAERKAKAQGVHCHVVQVEAEHPYKAIIDTAKKSGCDLITMASHGRRGVSALVVGSVTNKVLTHSSIPVLVYR